LLLSVLTRWFDEILFRAEDLEIVSLSSEDDMPEVLLNEPSSNLIVLLLRLWLF